MNLNGCVLQILIFMVNLHPSLRLSCSTYLDKVNPKGIYIEEYTYLVGCSVLTHDMCKRMRVQTHIGKKCSIVTQAIIMCGITIGDEIIVGSKAIISKDVPSNCIIVGKPTGLINKTFLRTNMAR